MKSFIRKETPKHCFINGGGYMDDNCIMGIKGEEYLEAGYIYVPYIPLMVESEPLPVTPTRPTLPITTRYGTIDGRYYGSVVA